MPEESIVKPKAFKGFSAPKVFYVPVDSNSDIVKTWLQERADKELTLPTGHIFSWEDRIVLYGCVGAPSAVLSLESLIVSGAKDVVVLGICGSLCRRARLFDAVSIVEARADEGTSPHYFADRQDFYPSLELRERVEAVIRSAGLPILTGSVVSTDAPYRETQSWVDKHLEMGLDCVDMETSAVFALAEHHELQAAALLIVSDELSDCGHNRGFLNPRLEEQIRDNFLPLIEKL
jgi:purine-nucleoside phosphorylase